MEEWEEAIDLLDEIKQHPEFPDDYNISGEDETEIVCKFCGKKAEKNLKCSRCMRVSYCSAECQKKDWS